MYRSYLLTIIIFASCFALDVSAQITSLKYAIDHNEHTDLYDCKIVVTGGSATSVVNRVQLNSQFSVVVPTGSVVTIEELHMPLANNQNYAGTEPMKWYIGSSVSQPAAQPQSDYYGIVPRLAPGAFYNDLHEGDEVTLFSLAIDSPEVCDRNIRLYNADVDPASNDAGMFGGDFRNGMSIGGTAQLYQGNEMPLANMKASIEDVVVCAGECVQLAPAIECMAYPFSYSWSTGEVGHEIQVCPTQSTNFRVSIVDGTGEMNVVETFVKVVEDGTNGCSTTSTTEVESDITLYPNPVTDRLHFMAATSQDLVSVLDSHGKVLLKQIGVKEGTFDTTDLPSGLYHIVYAKGQNVVSKRFIKAGQ